MTLEKAMGGGGGGEEETTGYKVVRFLAFQFLSQNLHTRMRIRNRSTHTYKYTRLIALSVECGDLFHE